MANSDIERPHDVSPSIRSSMTTQWMGRRRALRSGLVITLILSLAGLLLLSTDISVQKFSSWGYTRVEYANTSDSFKTSPKTTKQTTTTTTTTLRPAPLTEAPEYTYSHRSRVATDACFGRNLGFVKRIARDKQNRIANCIVPKVGCTYWINIFRYLNNDTGGHVYASPFEIPRWFTHYGKKTKEEAIQLNETGPSFLANALRFMFVREPYSRLWSAWIDKFWLPDFWHFGGKQMVRTLKLKGKCHFTSVTFVEFLKYVTSPRFMKSPASENEHWVPYKYLCDPCVFRPHVIGKIETFSRDTSYILSSTNLTWVLDPSHSINGTTDARNKSKHIDHSLLEMKLLTEYNVKEYFQRSKKYFGNCSSLQEIYQRIWKAFQYNGHIPADKNFPAEIANKTNYKMSDFLATVEETYLNWTNRSKAVQSKQKRDAMLKAYKKVPNDVMKKLQDLYRIDFEMFEYEVKPEDLYEGR